ncbi:phasin family protein [Methylobacterium currus]|uniref:phasin family protein n=1 Tax=Methylobacterium currus TaxID=2051553 RepID=UPI001E4176DF|nr:phasin family protein [Methylobacterium currus]UHC17092.1 phasin family protein [Methylobacterium currus]
MHSRTTGTETPRTSGFGDMSTLLTTETKLWRSFGVDLPLRLAAEILSFGSRRLQAQAEHVAALGRCGSPTETLKLQADFVMKTLTDYQREADTLSRDVVDVAVPGFGKAA